MPVGARLCSPDVGRTLRPRTNFERADYGFVIAAVMFLDTLPVGHDTCARRVSLPPASETPVANSVHRGAP
jgi:hypothetical protein